MNIEFKCENCGQLMSIDEEHAGKQADCPKCGVELTIPGPATEVESSTTGRKKCPKCRKIYPESTVICTNCGTNLLTGRRLVTKSTPAVRKSSRKPVVGVVIIVLVLIGGYMLAKQKLQPSVTKAGPALNAKLLEAVKTADLDVTRELLDKGADVNARDKWGRSLLWYSLYNALANDKVDQVKRREFKEITLLLIEKGVNVEYTDGDQYQRTPLHRAASGCDKDIVKALIEKGAKIDAITRYTGETPLHHAVMFTAGSADDRNRLDVVKLLVEHGANVNVKNSESRTPIQCAEVYNSDAVRKAAAKYMRKHGTKGPTVQLDKTKYKSITRAAEANRLDAVKYLVGKGADINEICADGTSLHIAARKNYADIAEFLIKNGANVNAKDPENRGATPLVIAASSYRKDMMKLLINNGADVNVKSFYHRATPLHQAVSKKDKEMVQLLIDKGAHIEAKTKEGKTALHIAVTNGYKDIVRLMVEKGADVNAKDSIGRSGVMDSAVSQVDKTPEGKEKIAVLVHESDYDQLISCLSTYETDVEQRFYVDLLIVQGDWETAEAVRGTLLDLYNKQEIVGAVLVGLLPYAVWYDPGPQPLSIFYEDLDGDFRDIGYMKAYGEKSEPDNGIYDFWETKEPDPLEIWVTWIRPQSSDPDHIATLKRFFNKTHNYYIGNAIYPKRGLIHAHTTYPGAANPGSKYYNIFSEIYGDDLFVEGGTLRYPYPILDYRYRLTEGFELVSAPWCHGTGFMAGDLSALHVQGMQPPRSLMTIAWSCSSANWYNNDHNLGIAFVMGNSLVKVRKGLLKHSDRENIGKSAYSDGQVYIGVNRPIGTPDNYMVFQAMAEGQYAGEAYMKWLKYEYGKDHITHFWDMDHPWDFIFIGNPFIRLNDVRIETAEPHYIYEGYDNTNLIITGNAFETGARVRLNNIVSLGKNYFCNIVSVCPYRIEAELPESIPLGVYHVTVSNPNGEAASMVDHLYVISRGDSDGDGLKDIDEVEKYFCNPFNSDTDNDKLTDGEEVSGVRNTHYGNQPTDPADPDSDGDNLLSDYDEITGKLYYGTFFTNPCDWDTDNDRLADGCEKNPLVADKGPYSPDTDTDSDGLTDKEENFPYKTFPAYADSDNDGLKDGQERDYWKSRGIDPNGDIDRDKQRNILDRDSDNDSLTDGIEVNILGTDPANDDTDSDGMPDGWEVYYSLDPLVDDSGSDADGDGVSNLCEYLAGTEPQKRAKR